MPTPTAFVGSLLLHHAVPFAPRSTDTSPLRRVTIDTGVGASQRSRTNHIPCMVDQNAVLGVLVGLVGVGGGIALVAWTENQGKRTSLRQNTQPCVECRGGTTISCSVCNGSKRNPLDPDQPCSYCDGAGSIKCLNCKGTGIQPRFLDRSVISLQFPYYLVLSIYAFRPLAFQLSVFYN